MLCCHGNSQWTQRFIIVAFIIAGIPYSSLGESINNGSQPEILLAPEMDVPVSVLQSKSPLDPQDNQQQVASSGASDAKTPVAAALEIPEVEIGLPDGDKQNTQPGSYDQEQTPHGSTAVEINRKESRAAGTSTEESEATSSGFEPVEVDHREPNEHVHDVEYASGNDNTERSEVTSENPENFSRFDFDTTHSNGTSERNHVDPEDFVQTEVVYDVIHPIDVSTSSKTNLLATNSNVSFYETRIVNNSTTSEYPAPSTTSPSEQPDSLSTSTNGYGDYTNISDHTLIPPEPNSAVVAESTQMPNGSMEFRHMATSNIFNGTAPEEELVLPQNLEIQFESTKNTSSSFLSTNTTQLLNTAPVFGMTSTYIMDSQGPKQVTEDDMLNNNSHVSATASILNSFSNADFQSTVQVPMQTVNVTDWSSISTAFVNHYSTTAAFNGNHSNTNITSGGGYNARVELFARHSDSQENVVSERINPTKPSSYKDESASDSQHGRSETDAHPKPENDIKSGDYGNKTQDLASSYSDIPKNATEVYQKTSMHNLTTTPSLQSQWMSNVPELVSSIQMISATDLPSFSTEIWLESALRFPKTAVFHGNSSIPVSSIQPSQTQIEQSNGSTTTNQNFPTTSTPTTESDHILPTVKIPTTYLSMTLKCSWSHFCLHQEDLRNILARCLSNVTKYTIRPFQIIFFNTNVCTHVSYSENEVNDGYINSIVVQMYVTNKHGDSSEPLTERLGIALVKNKLQGFNDKIKLQDVVMAVQLIRKEEQPQSAVVITPKNESSDTGIIAAITISGIASVCLILLCILLIVLKRRHILKQQSRRCRPVRADAYSLDSISIYSSFYKRKVRASKRSYLNQGFEDPNAPTNKLNFGGLANLSTDENALAEEYKQIPMAMAKFGDLPPGADLKNRYANVIPFPETRVQLPVKEGDLTLGYINANYVRGFRGDQKTYIACQAPLESTVADFWEMIWENQCKVIIMLTDWEEDGVPKCFPYFAESATLDSHRRFGDFQVTTKKIDTRESFTISSIQLKNLEKNLMRDVFHYWYTAWPSVGVPSDRMSIIELLTEARSTMRAASAPTVVHCSPGTGRTGTILAIHTSIQEYETSRTLDIPQCVYRLRRDRGGCVQTSEQYKFIYEVLHEFASQFRNPSGRSSIRSSKGRKGSN